MKQAPAHKQWAMNHCLAEIDYPASPGCTPPYAPMWIAEMVRRHEEARGRA